MIKFRREVRGVKEALSDFLAMSARFFLVPDREIILCQSVVSSYDPKVLLENSLFDAVNGQLVFVRKIDTGAHVGSCFTIDFLASRFTIRPSNRTLLNSEKKYAPNASTRFTHRRIPSSNLLVFSMLLGDVVNLCQMYEFPLSYIDWRFFKYDSRVSIQSEPTT